MQNYIICCMCLCNIWCCWSIMTTSVSSISSKFLSCKIRSLTPRMPGTMHIKHLHTFTHVHTKHQLHTDLCQPHPATLTPFQTPSLQRWASDHRHRLHLFLPTPVRAQDATHIGGRSPGLVDFFLLSCLSFGPPSSSLPLCPLCLVL